MLNANNTYFENLKKIGHDWEIARAERQARKQPIIDTYGWESEELKAWYAEDAAAKFPFESGVSKAYRAWAQSLSRKEDELEMDDFLWDKEVADFIHQPEHGGDGEPPRLCRAGLQDDRPLHHHQAGDTLGRRRAGRDHGHPLQPELKEVPE